jgi:hypothetical protein
MTENFFEQEHKTIVFVENANYPSHVEDSVQSHVP